MSRKLEVHLKNYLEKPRGTFAARFVYSSVLMISLLISLRRSAEL